MTSIAGISVVNDYCFLDPLLSAIRNTKVQRSRQKEEVRFDRACEINTHITLDHSVIPKILREQEVKTFS